ncbi:hypothetical protein [Streptomyces murinus]|uniref:hypothetical protein n=1 Tax=Streptomyces murinus TaxID=33900 RepID=UPI0018F48FF7|nr:hypothetical protein [Streptomyces murinus]
MARQELTAAASRYTSRKIRGRGPGDQSWQQRAYDMYHQVPEVRFAASWISNAMSGVRLFAGRRADDGTIEPAPAGHLAHEVVSQIAGGPDGQAKMLGAFGKHLTVPGEGWVIVRPNSEVLSPYSPEDGHDWRVLSVKEVRQQSGKLIAEIDGEEVPIPEGDPDNMDPDAPVAIRVWEPDPERAIEADSPVRSSLELLEELLLLNAAVKAIARSRITGRGLLLIPKGTRFPTAGTQQGQAEDDLIEIFMTIAETAIRDPESAAATVPIILELPADAIAEFKHIKFESEFDELAIKLREEAVRRFATGLEIPAEILLGLGDVNHWGQWALTSEAIRLGIEPKAGTVCYAFTQQWLRPILEAEGVEDWHRWLVWYDTSPLRVRTNRSETALQAFDRGVISAQALRRETGFDEADAPSAEEKAARDKEAGTTDEGTEDTPPQAPDLPVDESEAPPETLPASARLVDEALLAATDGLIWSALGTAGRKLERTPVCPRSERQRAKQLPAAEIHTILAVEPEAIDRYRLLDGAWARVPEIAARYNVDQECLESAVDEYCRELLAAGVTHTFEQTVGALSTPCLVAAA